MKRILTIFLFLSAVIMGLAMPKLWLDWQDELLQETIDVYEPMLTWQANKVDGDITESETGIEKIMERLKLFETGPAISLPQGTTVDDEAEISERAIHFLNALFEVRPEIYGYMVDFRYAWFEEGEVCPIWTVEMAFNEGWHCTLDIDEESGAILRCIIQSDSQMFATLFPDSFAACNGEESSLAFQERMNLRFCEALRYFMLRYMNLYVDAWPTAELDGIQLTMVDHPNVSLRVGLYVNPDGSLRFNYPPISETANWELPN